MIGSACKLAVTAGYSRTWQLSLVCCLMRVVADFLIVIGAMLLTGTAGVMGLSVIAVAVSHTQPIGAPFGLLIMVLMAGMLGAGMFTTGILLHLRKWQND